MYEMWCVIGSTNVKQEWMGASTFLVVCKVNSMMGLPRCGVCKVTNISNHLALLKMHMDCINLSAVYLLHSC